MNKKNNTININYYSVTAIVLLFCVIIGKLIFVSYADKVDGVDIHTIAANRLSKTEILTASRGNIYSINGETLAQDVNSYTVIAFLEESRTTNQNNPRHVVDKEYTANVLSEYINMSPERILSLLNLNLYQVELGPGGRNISERQKREIEALDLPGIAFTSSTKRYYPYGDFASYIIGYAKKQENGSISGELGVEAYYNKELTGKNGYTTYQQDAYGYQIADTPVITEKAISGKDIYLTIDSNIQMYLENALAELEKNNKYEWVTVTVANAKTGAILGSSNTPSYDPNILNITNWNNPLVSYSYEPGSTMKIFSFMAAMEEGIYDGEAEFLSGTKYVGKNTVNDWNKIGWGNISYDVGFTYSSNVAAAELGLNLGRDKLKDYYKSFGFGSKTGVQMANEYSGTINPVYELEVANAAFGQGITTTPIQNIQALTSLANDGVVIKPYIVDKIVDHDTEEILYKSKREELGQAVSSETVDKMLELMYLTVNGDDPVATGRVYKTEGTTLVGKTGTAQIASASGGYQTGTYNNIKSFAGVFPYEDPEYIIYISVKKLVGSSSTLAGCVKSIVESIAKYKNLDELIVSNEVSKTVTLNNYINRETSTAVTELENLGLEVITIGLGERVIDQYPMKGSKVTEDNKVFIRTNSLEVLMPNMIGWTSNEVQSYCNILGIKFNIDGYGRVTRQSIEANTVIDLNSTLDFTLAREESETTDDETA